MSVKRLADKQGLLEKMKMNFKAFNFPEKEKTLKERTIIDILFFVFLKQDVKQKKRRSKGSTRCCGECVPVNVNMASQVFRISR